MKNGRLFNRRNGCLGLGGSAILLLAVLSSISLGFASFLIGPSMTETGPITANVGTIHYGNVISLDDIGLSLPDGTINGPLFAEISSEGSDIVSYYGQFSFEVAVEFSNLAMRSLDFYEDLYLKVSFSLSGPGAIASNNVLSMDVCLANYENYYFGYDGERNIDFADELATTIFTIPIKSIEQPSIWTLMELDLLDSAKESIPFRFLFFIDSGLDETALIDLNYNVEFSLTNIEL